MKKKKSLFAKVCTSRTFFVFIIVIAAFVSAFLGQLLITNLSSSPSLIPPLQIIKESSSSSVSELDRAYTDILDRELSGLVALYSGSQAVYEELGRGIVLTNDGWVAALKTTESASAIKYVKLASGELIPVLSQIDDPSSDFIFLQIDSMELRPVTLATTVPSNIAQEVVAIDFGAQISKEFLRGAVLRDSLYLSDYQLNRFVQTTKVAPGSVFYNSKAELIGMAYQNTDSSTLVIPVNEIRVRLDDVLKNKQVDLVTLNLSYIDLSQHTLADEFSHGRTSGALISVLPGQNRRPLSTTSQAYLDGLRLGDIIVSVNSEPLTNQVTLSELIASKSVGEGIELGILRGKDSLTIQTKVLSFKQ